MINNKNLAQTEKQQFIQQEQKIEQIQEILNKFKQPIPANFVELESEERNYCGSTNPK